MHESETDLESEGSVEISLTLKLSWRRKLVAMRGSRVEKRRWEWDSGRVRRKRKYRSGAIAGSERGVYREDAERLSVWRFKAMT